MAYLLGFQGFTNATKFRTNFSMNNNLGEKMIKVIAEYKFVCNGVKGIRVILKQDGKLIEINKRERA